LTLKGQKNHYNVKFLKGYGLSIRQSNNQIQFTDGKNPFSDDKDTESYYVSDIPYEKIVVSGNGYISTNAIESLLENNIHIILTDTFGVPITSITKPMFSGVGTKRKMAQYATFSDDTKREVLQKMYLKKKISSQIEFLKSVSNNHTSIQQLRDCYRIVDLQNGYEKINGVESNSSKTNFKISEETVIQLVYEALLYLKLKNLDSLDPLQEGNRFGAGFS